MSQTDSFDPRSLQEYEDWLQDRLAWLKEQDHLSDDKHGIVCARDTDWE